MASLFKPDVPQPDPQIAQQQKDEQTRAQTALTKSTQDQLRLETNLRSHSTNRGVRSLLGSFGTFGNTLGSG